MATRIKFDVPPEYVPPKLEDLEIPSVDLSALAGHESYGSDTGVTSISEEDSPQSVKGSGYRWFGWGINIDLSGVKEVTDVIKSFLEKVDTITKVLTAVLKIIRVFSSDFKSIARLLKVILKVLVKKLQDMIDGFTSSGMFVSVIFPNINTKSESFLLPINGGYKEFVTSVNQRCLNSKDEDAPKFGTGDVVGGIVIGMIGGANDPQFLYDLTQNFRILGRLFRFRPPTPSPAKNVRAVAGFFADPADERPRRERALRMGIKVTWEHPGTPLSGFIVRRSPFRDGIASEVVSEKGTNVPIRVFRDEEFDKEQHLFNAVVGKPKYSFVDFNVTENQVYFYKVFSTVGYDFFDKHPFFERLESPVASKTVYAIPRNKIPLSELVKETVYDINGNRVRADEFDGEWQSLTIRTLLGPEVDRLLSLLDRLADKMSGMVSTSSDAMSDYLKFFQKKIKFYMDIVNKISDIAARLAEIRMSGTFLVLSIEPEKGGMENLVRKFNSAVLTEDVGGLQVGTNGSQTTVSSLLDKGIMAGVVLLYGYPQLDGDYVGNLVPVSQQKELEASLDKSKKALKAFLSLLGLGG